MMSNLVDPCFLVYMINEKQHQMETAPESARKALRAEIKEARRLLEQCEK